MVTKPVPPSSDLDAGEAAEVRPAGRSRPPGRRASSRGARAGRGGAAEERQGEPAQDRGIMATSARSRTAAAGRRGVSGGRRRRRRRVRVGRQQRVGHPPDRVRAAVAGGHRVGIDAAGRARPGSSAGRGNGRCGPTTGRILRSQSRVARGRPARRADSLTGGGDEDALDAGVAGGGLDQAVVGGRPAGVDVALVGGAHVDRRRASRGRRG